MEVATRRAHVAVPGTDAVRGQFLPQDMDFVIGAQPDPHVEVLKIGEARIVAADFRVDRTADHRGRRTQEIATKEEVSQQRLARQIGQ